MKEHELLISAGYFFGSTPQFSGHSIRSQACLRKKTTRTVSFGNYLNETVTKWKRDPGAFGRDRSASFRINKRNK